MAHLDATSVGHAASTNVAQGAGISGPMCGCLEVGQPGFKRPTLNLQVLSWNLMHTTT